MDIPGLFNSQQQDFVAGSWLASNYPPLKIISKKFCHIKKKLTTSFTPAQPDEIRDCTIRTYFRLWMEEVSGCGVGLTIGRDLPAWSTLATFFGHSDMMSCVILSHNDQSRKWAKKFANVGYKLADSPYKTYKRKYVAEIFSKSEASEGICRFIEWAFQAIGIEHGEINRENLKSIFGINCCLNEGDVHDKCHDNLDLLKGSLLNEFDSERLGGKQNDYQKQVEWVGIHNNVPSYSTDEVPLNHKESDDFGDVDELLSLY